MTNDLWLHTLESADAEIKHYKGQFTFRFRNKRFFILKITCIGRDANVSMHYLLWNKPWGKCLIIAEVGIVCLRQVFLHHFLKF